MGENTEVSEELEMVALGGDLTVPRAAELRELLRESLNRYQAVAVRLEDVTAVDLSYLQLLCSAHRTASALDKRLTLEGARPAVFQQTVEQAGLMRQKGCTLSPNTTCLWCGGDQ